MDYMIFNGVSSQDLGFLVEKLPDEHRPKRDVEQIQIPGRPGRVSVDLGSYDQYTTDCKINCNGHALTYVYAWLQGEGWLTTSQDPGFMRWVSFYDQQKDARFRVSPQAKDCFDTITIPITAQPYKYKAVQNVLHFAQNGVFDGEGNDIAAPIIEISGTGDATLMINGASVMLDDLDGKLYLDSDAMTAYTNTHGVTTFAGRKVTIIDDVWPYLEPGSNSISWTGGITAVDIRPWWRWL